MATNEQIIWKYLKSQGLTDAGVAGLMGNLYAESGLKPTNLQNTYEKKLGFTDASYTKAVDNGDGTSTLTVSPMAPVMATEYQEENYIYQEII